jgi:hypothetical protein
LWMADQLFVQWPQLQQQYPRATYVGRLMWSSINLYSTINKFQILLDISIKQAIQCFVLSVKFMQVNFL